jgi:hypothetical protein
MSIFTDVFTGTAASDLTAHTVTGGSGGPWARHVDKAGTIVFDTAGTGILISVTPAAYQPSGLTPPGADYAVTGTLRCKSFQNAGSSIYIGGRIGSSTGQLDGYYVRFLADATTDGAGTWQLIRFNTAGASGTTLGSYHEAAGGMVVGATRTVKLSMVGSAIRVDIDGVQRISVTDATVSRVGKPAFYGTSVGSATAGYHWASITVDDLSAAQPVNTAVPAITTDGSPAVGETVSCDTGTWTGSPTSYAYQWKRDGVAISGATGSTYTIVSADAGTALTCTVTATNGVGSASATSGAVAVPAAPVNTVAPAVTTDGTPATGETITSDHGTWTGTGITYAYQWYRGVSPITGETAASYTLLVTDEGANITCRVTATNGGGSATANSNIIVPAVTAAIGDDSFLTYYSGGSGNTDPALAIGGARGGTYPGGLNALFGPIPGTVAQAGGVFYRVIYVRNTHTISTAAACKAFIEQQLAHAGMHIAVAVPAEGVNTTVPALASGTTAPSGVTWATTTDPAAGAAFGDLGPGQYRGLYVRLTIDASTTAVTEDDFILAVEGSAA